MSIKLPLRLASRHTCFIELLRPCESKFWGFFQGKIRFMPPQLREIGCHVENHATQWHDFQHEIQFQEIGVAWIQLTLLSIQTNGGLEGGMMGVATPSCG